MKCLKRYWPFRNQTALGATNRLPNPSPFRYNPPMLTLNGRSVPLLKSSSDNVIIRQEDAPEFTPGGIALPEVARDQPAIGVVVAVGPGRAERKGRHLRYAGDVRPGDRVYYHGVAAKKLDVEGESFVVVEAPNVLGVLE